jgi:hypothetical protein
MTWEIEESVAVFTPDSAEFELVQNELQQKREEWSEKHLILNSLGKECSLENLEAYAEIIEAHREAGHSFVLVHDQYTYEDLPETLPVVPTVQEAHDLIEMEDIERDLGF